MINRHTRKVLIWLMRIGLLAIMLAALPAQAAGLLQPDGPTEPDASDGTDVIDAPTDTDDIAFSEKGLDFRISNAGPNSNTNYRAVYPAIAYNSTDKRYLVVWWGDDNDGGMVTNEYEIFGQQLAGSTGAEISSDFRISFMGVNGNISYSALNPDVAYNHTNNEYLVVWSGENQIDKYEIWGQRLNGATGAAIGSNFRISSMGPVANVDYDAYNPSVAWNSIDNEYLVVWSGDSSTHGTINEEFEIFAQRIEANTGNLIGPNTPISDMGPNANASYDADAPDVAYSPTANEYWVAWAADHNTGGMVDDELEIFMQRLDASTGAEIGPGDYRVSTMGPAGNAAWDASSPQVACASYRNECLFSWSGEHNTNGQVDNEFEIFIQRVAGPNPTTHNLFGQYRISAMNGFGDSAYSAYLPHLAYNSALDEYLVSWYGKGMARANLQTEVFVQRIRGATQAQIGNEVAISEMGPEGVDTLQAQSAAVAFNPDRFEYLVIWHGDHNLAPLINDELEVFGQRLTGGDLIQIMLPIVTR